MLRSKDDEFHRARSYNSCNEKGRVVSNSGSSNYGSVTHPSDHDKDNDVLVPEESSFCNSPLEGKLDTTKEKAFSEQISLCNSRCNETHLAEEKETHDDGFDPLVADEDGDVNPMGQRILISEREMIKETDEYKRAMEEEWASRQQ